MTILCMIIVILLMVGISAFANIALFGILFSDIKEIVEEKGKDKSSIITLAVFSPFVVSILIVMNIVFVKTTIFLCNYIMR